MFSQLIQQSSSFAARILVSLISLLLSVVIVRLYTKAIVGDFFLLTSYSTVLAQVFLFGMAPALNIMSSRGAQLKKILLEVTKKNIISTLCTLLCGLILLFFFAKVDYSRLILLSLLSGVLLIICEIMKGQGMFILSQVFNGGLNNLLFLVFIVILIQNKKEADLEEIIGFYALAYMCIIITGAIYLAVKYKENEARSLTGNIITYSVIMPIFISTVIIYMFSQIDLWFVSRLFDNEVVAQYGLAIRLTAVLSFSTLSVRAIAAARIPKLMSNIQALQKDISLSCLFSFLVSFAILCGIVLFGNFFIGLIYGNGYELTWYVLLIFSFGQMINAATGPCDYLLSHTGHGRYLMLITLVSFLLLMVLLSIITLRFNSVFLFCSAVSFTICLQNLIIIYVAFKKTGVISLPLIKYKRTYIS
ncbi:hypothetical protein U0102_18825 [Enterobacter hormaechei]|uniref:Putative O-antigen transporter n=1 Tax=Enterobacter hormaechei TaxID=158836 RepID=A0A6G4MLY4_9ENTR|nr:hypothetical protein [Enterobacter hormaechei]KLQ35345.1 hypothetical protein ABF72_01170 [Enterobacter hormaechei subsp. steigerwaltii]MVX95249.1 hypothetical protein [Enterobacteriaceae bacterium 8376wB9]NGF42176.1 hypothetical protein [Enterobacter hormaechei]HEM8720671.1 hypothetical protein [Enterobacter hormaechei]